MATGAWAFHAGTRVHDGMGDASGQWEGEEGMEGGKGGSKLSTKKALLSALG